VNQVRPNQTARTPSLLDGALNLCFDPAWGTPVALIETARRDGRVQVRAEVDPDEVLVEFPMGREVQTLTGYRRFVSLKAGGYALVI
jgi:hypothetical protein